MRTYYFFCNQFMKQFITFCIVSRMQNKSKNMEEIIHKNKEFYKRRNFGK